MRRASSEVGSVLLRKRLWTAAIETTKPFGDALRELVLESDYATQTGVANWTAFAAHLHGLHYETLRRAVSGERRPSVRLLEACARVLSLRPEYFLEYRLHKAQRDFDPDAVGVKRARENLEAWTRASAGPTRPST